MTFFVAIPFRHLFTPRQKKEYSVLILRIYDELILDLSKRNSELKLNALFYVVVSSFV